MLKIFSKISIKISENLIYHAKKKVKSCLKSVENKNFFYKIPHNKFQKFRYNLLKIANNFGIWKNFFEYNF